MNWFAPIFSTDAPQLPNLVLTQWWLSLGWAVVLAWVVAGVARWLGLPRAVQRGLALVAALWTCVPGTYAPGYWLGLAFQAPSISLVVLCGWSLYWQYARPVAPELRVPLVTAGLAWAGITLGWILLLDTLAMFPVALYAWGFSPIVPVLVLLGLLLPWALRREGRVMAPEVSMVGIAIMAFVVLRLPTGNAWDALLDPWLWLALHVVAFRAWRLRRSTIHR